MCPNLYSTDFLEVAFRPDLGLLRARWLRDVSQVELYAGYENLRRATLHCGASSWLVDSRRRTSLSHYSPDWVKGTFLPQVQREMGRPLHVSFLMLPDYHQGRTDAPGSSEASSLVHCACFLDEGEADAWLAARPVAVAQPK